MIESAWSSPDEAAEPLASETTKRGTSTEDLAPEVPKLHAPLPTSAPRVPSWVGVMHSGRDDLSERHEEILKSEFGHRR
jgi:hypothetical protein